MYVLTLAVMAWKAVRRDLSGVDHWVCCRNVEQACLRSPKAHATASIYTGSVPGSQGDTRDCD